MRNPKEQVQKKHLLLFLKQFVTNIFTALLFLYNPSTRLSFARKTNDMNSKNLLKLAGEFGAPLYVYDAEKIASQYHRLTQAFEGVSNLRLNYAAKALSNISILRFMNHLGSGLDTVSIQEVKLGLLAGFAPESIIFTPNGVSLEEIEQAAALGVQINIDNLSILEQFGSKHPDIPVCIRINPHVMAGGNSKISVGHIDSKFGISIHQIPHLLRIVELTNMTINGIHMHTGSDILDIDVFLYASEILFETAKNFKDLEFIDFGSGFKVPYKKGDIHTNVEELGKKLTARFNEFCAEYGRELTLAFEPGKFLVSEAGYFLAKVNVVKQTTSTVFASVDSGFNHLIRPMLYGSTHEIVNISNPKGRERYYSVVGYICETDTFGSNRRINEISEGDILCFKNAGAYCFTMASNYNSRFRPAEVLWYNDKAHLIRERETFDDILKNQVDVKELFEAPKKEVVK
jgi:diaminopimelate decarboxylase